MENLKLKNNHRLVIGNLNINSTSNKFDILKLITQGKIDKLVISKAKTDSTFPLNQFAIQSYLKLYRFDWNRNRGGVFTYVREVIPSRQLCVGARSKTQKPWKSQIFFLAFSLLTFQFWPKLKNENSEEENSENKFWCFPSFQSTIFQFNFQFRYIEFFHTLWHFLFSFLALFEFAILGYWTAIIQYANLCSKSHK